MGKPKGSPKTGGRQKGTPNKTTTKTRAVLMKWVEEYHECGQFAQDIEDIGSPKDRLDFYAKILPYITPRLQAVAAEVTNSTAKTIEDTLIQLAQENE